MKHLRATTVLLFVLLAGTAHAEDHASFRGAYVGMPVDDLRRLFPLGDMWLEPTPPNIIPPPPAGTQGLWATRDRAHTGAKRDWQAQFLVKDGVVDSISFLSGFFDFAPTSLKEFVARMCEHYRCEHLAANQGTDLLVGQITVVRGRLPTGEAVEFLAPELFGFRAYFMNVERAPVIGISRPKF